LQPNRLADGVGCFSEQEQPVPLVLRPSATRAEAEGQDMIAKSLQLVAEAPPGPGGIAAAARWVLSENKARAKDANNAEEFSTERRRSRSLGNSSAAVFLAGVASADDIDVESVERLLSGWEVADIGKPFNARKVTGQNLQTVGVFLDLPSTAQPGPLKAQVEAAHASEQAAEGQWPVAGGGGDGGAGHADQGLLLGLIASALAVGLDDLGLGSSRRQRPFGGDGRRREVSPNDLLLAILLFRT
jgi:hypothetical protein